MSDGWRNGRPAQCSPFSPHLSCCRSPRYAVHSAAPSVCTRRTSSRYFAWIRDASVHLLAGDRFNLARGPRTFLQPAFVLSGLLHRATGLSIPVTHLAWELLAIPLIVLGCSRYARRMLPDRGARNAAMALAVFGISPLYLALSRVRLVGPAAAGTAADLSREVWLAGYLWGYQVTAIAIALMPLALLELEVWRGRRRGLPWVAAGGVFLITWLHPWQGATVLLAATAAEGVLWLRTGERPCLGWLVVAAAFAIPAVYFEALPHIDPAWRVYQQQNSLTARPWLPPLVALLPLAAPALLAYGRRVEDWQGIVVRAWPLAALLMYVMPVGAFPFHAFDGIVIPLAVLAVDGALRLWPHPRPTLVVLAIALMTVPGWADGLRTIGAKARSGEHGYFIAPSEQRALDALERDPRPGGVLTGVSTGALVPYTTGREVYVGHDSWSPRFHDRARLAEDLFHGRMIAADARVFVRATHARFLLSDCRHSFDLRPHARADAGAHQPLRMRERVRAHRAAGHAGGCRAA